MSCTPSLTEQTRLRLHQFLEERMDASQEFAYEAQELRRFIAETSEEWRAHIRHSFRVHTAIQVVALGVMVFAARIF